ncbi:ABC transporter substrate-binding protein [Rhizobium lusitanum]|uniref:ABC transporter substrate-binding protein n=1 Tax=Rhizobium lusitanum TaxID=293958 RepID=A0A6L9UDA5_9HYPH|nr:ABC transporter substrate-binding protein [Rhizobium lusitanum]NEI72150.1 ABC transporter substrate-binding protein [Rhizobium lusitanum]
MALAFAGLAPGHSARAAKAGLRVASLDITATHIAVSAGANLIAAASAGGFRAGSADLVLDAGIVDIGHPAEPNLELLQSLRPDLLLAAWPLAEDAPVRRIAPALTLDLFGNGDDWLTRIERAVLATGERVGSGETANEARAAAERQFNEAKQSVAGREIPPIYLVNLNQDGASLLVYGRNSLMDAVMQRLGIGNAWASEADMWGWSRADPQALMDRPEATIMHLQQYWEGPGLAMRRLTSGPIWNALPQIRTGRFRILPPIDIFGGLPSAVRFAALITGTLDSRQTAR